MALLIGGMSMKRWLAMSAASLGRGIESGNIDPVTLTQTYLEAIDVTLFEIEFILLLHLNAR